MYLAPEQPKEVAEVVGLSLRMLAVLAYENERAAAKINVVIDLAFLVETFLVCTKVDVLACVTLSGCDARMPCAIRLAVTGCASDTPCACPDCAVLSVAAREGQAPGGGLGGAAGPGHVLVFQSQ